MADNSNISLAINQPHHRSVSADEFSGERSTLRDRQTQIRFMEDVLGGGGLGAALGPGTGERLWCRRVRTRASLSTLASTYKNGDNNSTCLLELPRGFFKISKCELLLLLLLESVSL